MKTYDPRSKLVRHDKNGEPMVAVEMQLTVPNVLIVVTVFESSSWSGQKFDGRVYLANKETLDAFAKKLNETKSREEYNFIKDVRLCAVTDECIEELTQAIKDHPERPWLWTNADHTVKLWD